MAPAAQTFLPVFTMHFLQDRVSWAESHALVLSGINTLFGALSFAQALYTARVAMLGWGVLPQNGILHDAFSWRNTLDVTAPKVFAGAAGGPIPAGTFCTTNVAGNGFADDPWDVSLFRLDSQLAVGNVNIYHGDEYIAGLPAMVHSDAYAGGYSTWPGWLTTATFNYFQMLTGNPQQNAVGPGPFNWGTKVYLKGSDGPNPGIILSAVTTGNGIITYTTNAQLTVPVGRAVRILGVKSNPGANKTQWNGTKNVQSATVVAPFQFSVNQPNALTPNSSLGNSGTVQQIQSYYVQYDYWDYVGSTHRKRGGTYGGPKGRKKHSQPGAVVF